MTDYECPDCGGGFPTNPDKECPWCGTPIDGSYGKAVEMPFANLTKEQVRDKIAERTAEQENRFTRDDCDFSTMNSKIISENE